MNKKLLNRVSGGNTATNSYEIDNTEKRKAKISLSGTVKGNVSIGENFTNRQIADFIFGSNNNDDKTEFVRETNMKGA